MTGQVTGKMLDLVWEWLRELDKFILNNDCALCTGGAFDVNKFLKEHGLTGAFNGVIVAGIQFPNVWDLSKVINMVLNTIYANGIPYNGDRVPFFFVDAAGRIFCFGCGNDARKLSAIRQAACSWYGTCSQTIYVCSEESLNVEPAKVRPEVAPIGPCIPVQVQ